MAKKVVASLHTAGKEFTKVIKMKKSEKTGAYYFEETIVPIDQAQEFIAKNCLSSFRPTVGSGEISDNVFSGILNDSNGGDFSTSLEMTQKIDLGEISE